MTSSQINWEKLEANGFTVGKAHNMMGGFIGYTHAIKDNIIVAKIGSEYKVLKDKIEQAVENTEQIIELRK